jgi:hypothetical protein
MNAVIAIVLLIWALIGLKQMKDYRSQYDKAFVEAFAPLDNLNEECYQWLKELGSKVSEPVRTQVKKRDWLENVYDLIAGVICGPWCYVLVNKPILDHIARMEKDIQELCNILRSVIYQQYLDAKVNQQRNESTPPPNLLN